MTAHQELQAKCQEEIDRAIGKSKILKLKTMFE